jgi:hypothetical protein
MNDHHFSYPVVVPLRGVTISGHSSVPEVPIGRLQTSRPRQAIRSGQPVRPNRPLVRHADVTPELSTAAVAWGSS